MKALVTGAGGFLGVRLCEALLKNNWDVVGVDRLEEPSFFQPLAKIKWIQKDLCKDQLVEEDLANVDVLFHLAAIIKQAGFKEEPNLFFRNEIISMNVYGSTAGPIKKIVHASTQMVYGDPNSLSVNESCPLGANITAYGISKLHCENWLHYFQRRSGASAVILRFTGFVEGEDSLINNLVRRAMDNKPIELFSMGAICRDYLAVTDSTQAFLAAADRLCKNNDAGVSIYNIGSGEAVSTIELAQCICSELGSSSRVIPVPTPAIRSNFVYDISRARTELKFLPTPMLKAAKIFTKEKSGNS